MTHSERVKSILSAVRAILAENDFSVDPLPKPDALGKYALATFWGVEHYTVDRNPSSQDEQRYEVTILIKITNAAANVTLEMIENTLVDELTLIEDILTVDEINQKIGYELVTNVDFLKSDTIFGINSNRFVEGQKLKVRYNPEAVA